MCFISVSLSLVLRLLVLLKEGDALGGLRGLRAAPARRLFAGPRGDAAVRPAQARGRRGRGQVFKVGPGDRRPCLLAGRLCSFRGRGCEQGEGGRVRREGASEEKGRRGVGGRGRVNRLQKKERKNDQQKKKTLHFSLYFFSSSPFSSSFFSPLFSQPCRPAKSRTRRCPRAGARSGTRTAAWPTTGTRRPTRRPTRSRRREAPAGCVDDDAAARESSSRRRRRQETAKHRRRRRMMFSFQEHVRASFPSNLPFASDS